MPSSSPDADTATATLGSESLLQASLRISVLMSRSIGPFGAPRAVPPAAPGAPGRPGGPAGWVETCVTWAITSIGRPARPLSAQVSPRRPVFGSPDALILPEVALFTRLCPA